MFIYKVSLKPAMASKKARYFTDKDTAIAYAHKQNEQLAGHEGIDVFEFPVYDDAIDIMSTQEMYLIDYCCSKWEVILHIPATEYPF